MNNDAIMGEHRNKPQENVLAVLAVLAPASRAAAAFPGGGLAGFAWRPSQFVPVRHLLRVCRVLGLRL